MRACTTARWACWAAWKPCASLKESDFSRSDRIELLMFTSEEPTRFRHRLPRIAAARRCASTPQTADALRDRLHETDPKRARGLTLQEVRDGAGFTGALAGVKLPPDYYDAWVELHIEQGPLLEREGIPLGIVTAIAAPASYRYTIEGFGGHAGALLMPDRRDALCAAAEIILSRRTPRAGCECAQADTGGVDTVATVGTVSVHPGAVNCVPSRVHADARHSRHRS